MVVKHALRAGLTPIVTAAGLDLAYLLGGAIITETIFSLPGMGIAGRRLGRALGPAADRRHHARHRRVHHLREPGRRPSLRRGRSAREGRMIGRLTRTVDRISTTATEERPFLTVNNLKVAFPDGGRPRPGRRRRLVLAREGQDARDRRRVGLRQERHRAGDHGSDRPQDGQGHRRDLARTTSSCWACPAAEMQAAARRRAGDDLPGPDVEPAPVLPGRRPDRRGDARTPQGQRQGGQARGRSTCSSASASRPPSDASTPIRTSSRAACASAS